MPGQQSDIFRFHMSGKYSFMEFCRHKAIFIIIQVIYKRRKKSTQPLYELNVSYRNLSENLFESDFKLKLIYALIYIYTVLTCNTLCGNVCRGGGRIKMRWVGHEHSPAPSLLFHSTWTKGKGVSSPI